MLLQERQKWLKSQRNVQVDDIVTVVDNPPWQHLGNDRGDERPNKGSKGDRLE